MTTEDFIPQPYTEIAQNWFNKYVDDITAILNEHGITHEGDK